MGVRADRGRPHRRRAGRCRGRGPGNLRARGLGQARLALALERPPGAGTAPLRRAQRRLRAGRGCRHVRPGGSRSLAGAGGPRLRRGAGVRQRHRRPGSPHGGPHGSVPPDRHARGARGSAAGPGGDRPRQRAWRRRAAARSGRNSGVPRGARAARIQRPGHLDQGDDRPAVRGGRGPPGGRRLLLAGRAVRSPDHEPRHRRPRVRPRLRAWSGSARPGEPRHGHLARHRPHTFGGHPRPPGRQLRPESP